jgi:acyl-coenzyme A synthetase/AMP-(fatty) acid ligase
MKPSRRVATALAVIVLALCAVPLAMAQSVGAPALAARSNDAGGVRVVVKPKSVAAGATWEFEVTMDTHSKPLDDDLTKTAVLVDDGGRQYMPMSWQGDKPGGHHRKGILRFPAPTGQIKSFELRIQGLGGESKRAFQWTIK